MKVDHAIGDGYPAKNWCEEARKTPQFFRGVALQRNHRSGWWDERRLRWDVTVDAIHEDNTVTYGAIGKKTL